MYIVLPRMFSTNAISSVDQTDPPRVQDIQGAVLVPMIWSICVLGTWYYWIRRPTAASKQSRESRF
jgi:hypothetical protein